MRRIDGPIRMSSSGGLDRHMVSNSPSSISETSYRITHVLDKSKRTRRSFSSATVLETLSIRHMSTPTSEVRLQIQGYYLRLE